MTTLTYKRQIKQYKIRAKVLAESSFKANTSKIVYEALKDVLYDDIDINVQEAVFAIMLNNANNVIGISQIGIGGINSCIVDVKLVCKYAVDSLASKVILVHNHPSGNLTPSTNDNDITERIKQALKTLDCALIDHLIFTNDSYYSFSDNGRL
jgi:DNA repair protein RadC